MKTAWPTPQEDLRAPERFPRFRFPSGPSGCSLSRKRETRVPRKGFFSRMRMKWSAGSDMTKKLFVGGLAWKTDDASLSEAFTPFGEIQEAKVVLDRETGRSRGFGFVTYTSDDAAEAAVKEMDGKMLDGRAIRVDIAREQPGGRR